MDSKHTPGETDSGWSQNMAQGGREGKAQLLLWPHWDGVCSFEVLYVAPLLEA